VPAGPAPSHDDARNFAPLTRARVAAAAAPSACRAVSWRAIPEGPIPATVPSGDNLETVALGSRVVVLRSGVGAVQAASWDAASNTWTDAGRGPTTFSRGDAGPFSGAHWLAVGDHVVLIWRNDSQRLGLQSALLDVAEGDWSELSSSGGPATVGIESVDTAGRLFTTEGHSLATARRFDPRSKTWASVSSDGAPSIGGVPTIVALGDRVLVFGRAPRGEGSVGALYDPQGDSWTPIVPGPTPEVGFVATTDDAAFWWGYTDPRHGGVYERSRDAWTVVEGVDAPTARPASGLDLFAFTGTHLVQAEEHLENRSAPHDPAVVYDVRARRWSRVPIPPTFGTPHALPDGRVVFFGGSTAPAIVVDPRSGLVCVPDLTAVPTLSSTPATSYAFAGVVGDELVLWGRTDVDHGPRCPPGAPCMLAVSRATRRDDGVAVRF
jgi:hypothetical protein